MNREEVLNILRQHWPESGGQSAHVEALAAQARCADALFAYLGFCPKDGDAMPCLTCGAGL